MTPVRTKISVLPELVRKEEGKSKNLRIRKALKN